MQPSRTSHCSSSVQPPHYAATLASSGDILFSSAADSHHPLPRWRHQNSSAFSLVDPGIELPTISANEVEQVLSQLQSSSSQPSTLSTSRKTTGCWLSKDDSFTPPPTKRSFGGSIAPVVTCASYQPITSIQPQSHQTRSSSLIAALQLPPLGTGQKANSSTTSPPLHAALRKQILQPSSNLTTLLNAAKQRQENLTVRLANRAKLTAAAARIPILASQPAADSDGTTPARSVVPKSPALATPSPSGHHIPKDPNERFRFLVSFLF
ncbi:unnamed protein product [Mesocestoides corti]|uniref:Uncharacterized protein n=2 Tax=Mesocestoides corti TaxID=53468 RepID=A0A0R3UP31_MESCO|nr:unnamed protein product [Mesocestoides corti]